VGELRRELKSTEQQKQNEIQQLAGLHRQERADLEHNFENKVSSCEKYLFTREHNWSGK
jgi:hypothetical protein